MAVNRQIKESPIEQGIDEEVAYTLTTTPWGSSPTSIAVKLYDVTGDAYSDVSGTKLSGNPSTVGDVITMPVVQLLEYPKTYRLEIKFTVSGNVFEAWCQINARR